ncbi:hypothetical protein [Brevundimonas sp.]|uniref:hypothetical protein n=1 Tax=Brevundimonas sp. TaxID=1871086 RepID=UPI003D0C8457
MALKTFRDEANYREIAGLWLGLGTVLGVLGLFIASLAIVWTIGSYENGQISLFEFAIQMTFFAGFVLAPVIGWALFSRRRYWTAILAGAFPILIVGGFLVRVASY